jgi:GTPase
MNEPSGNVLGLKPSQLKFLRNTFRRRVAPSEVISRELAAHLTQFSFETNRQVGVLLSRKGEVQSVIVGNAHQLELPDIGRARAGQFRLRGLRLVHTHLRSEALTRDDLTDLALLRLDLVAAIGIDGSGLPGVLHVGHLLPENPQHELWRIETYANIFDQQPDCAALIASLEDEFKRNADHAARTSGRERAVLVAVCLDQKRAASEASLAELKELARTAGVDVVDEVLQMRPKADPKFLLGRGKLDDINLTSMQRLASVLIFDCNLTPSQARGVSEVTALKVLDRTQLILDIFAQRAQSADGKLQVELAQLKYLLPRLVQSDDSLSRLAGGIGGRGPGETKLEIDRRRVRERISLLNKKIDALSSDRRTRRQQRMRKDLPVISIVGYTNAGKSTLLNALTRSNVLAEDKLFATLDPTSRRLKFPTEREVILTDTVGFIRDLPKDLVNAFRATLEELVDAALLLHVVDASDPQADAHIAAVESILASLDIEQTPRILVWNKADRLTVDARENLTTQRDGVVVSASEKTGFETLLERAERVLFADGKARHARALSADPERHAHFVDANQRP